MANKRISTVDIKSRKSGQPIVCLTAYTAPFAKILDNHVDLILVGDSVGMVLYGMESTLSVTLDIMINHGTAVTRASSNACVVVDMPFGSYQQSPQEAFASAARIISETNCQAVKLEGGAEMAETIKFLVERGIPVMAHIGLQPQMVNAYGGYSCQGKSEEAKKKIINDALSVQEAGAFAIVIEGVVESLAREVTAKTQIPIIGIGASPACDGQVLVTEDVAGLFLDFKPKFVKRYGNLAKELESAVKKYSKDVKERKFPSKENCF